MLLAACWHLLIPGELLLLDSLGRLVSKEYPQRVACHEAGHFLVAYLLGVLPKARGDVGCQMMSDVISF